MPRFRKSSSFCLICYKTIEISNITHKKLDNIKKFVKIVSQFAGTQQVYPLFDLVDGKKLLECCRECRTNIEKFCTIYDQIKIEELNIASIVDKLAEKINHGDRLPKRCKHVGIVLEQVFKNDQDKTVENQYRISRFRQSILDVGLNKKLRFQPAIIINLSENDEYPENIDVKDEFEEKYSPDEEIDIEDENTSNKPSETRRQKYVSFSFPGDDEGTSNGGMSRSEDHGGLNGDCAEESSEDYECVDTSEIDSTDTIGPFKDDGHIEIKQEAELLADEEKFKCENMQFNEIAEDGNYEELTNTTQDLQRDFSEHSNGWKGDLGSSSAIPSCSKNLTSVSKPSAKFKCEISTRKFTNSIRSNTHFKKMHDLSKISNKEKVFKCINWRGCKAYFLTKFQLRQHLKFEHGDGKKKGKVFNCDKCDTKFELEYLLKRHQEIHRNLYEWDCEKCGQKFETKLELGLHMKYHIRSGEKGIFKCETCGSEFNFENTLKIHLELHKEPGEWKFGCETCGKKFVTRGSLNYHEKMHKNEELHWECHICGVRFRDVKSLIGHLDDRHLN